MAKFVDLNNVQPVWNRINSLYVRKKDAANNVKNSLTLDISELLNQDHTHPIIDLSTHTPITISELIYNGSVDDSAKGVKSFIDDFASKKYIKDSKHTYSVIGEFINDNSMVEFEGIEVREQTNKLLVSIGNSLYTLWAIHLDKKQGSEDAANIYKIIQELYIDSITNEYINKL